MSKALTILLVLICASALVAIRLFESGLFYDPLIEFFKTNHSTNALPAFDFSKLLLHVFFRFVINTALSLLILWFAFKNKEVIQISLLVYSVAFVVLFGLFWYFLITSEAGNHMALFYTRRFLIQPLFLLILLPAFYFKKR